MPLISKAQARKLYPSTNSNLQTVLIPKEVSLKDSRAWLRKHGYLWQNHRNTTNERRFIQAYDVKDAQFYSKKLSNGVVLVFQSW